MNKTFGSGSSSSVSSNPLNNNYYSFICCSPRYQSILMLRQPLLKDSGNYTITAVSGSRTAQFSFNLKVKGKKRQTHRQIERLCSLAK